MLSASGSNAASVRPGVIGGSITRLRDFENLAQYCGWSINCRQLGPGRIRVDATMSRSAEAVIIDVRATHRIEAMGRTRGDTVAVILPAGNTRFLVNGYSIGAGDAIAIPPNHPLAAWCSADARMTLISLPAYTLDSARFFDPSSLRRLMRGETLHVDKNSAASARLHAKTSALLLEPSAPGTFVYRIEHAADIRDMEWQTEQPATIDETSYAIIRRAIAFVEANLGENISIKDMSKAAATSLSKLERTFRNMLDMSPSQYVLARRLSSARRTLAEADARKTSVATIALDNGFNHLGRFSGTYRNYFDELPKETLQQQVA